jgi:RNA polymerase sigma factor (sigma-70 family)
MRADAGVVGGLPAALLRSASDQRLVEHVRAGSHRAFETLFDRHHRAVLSFCAHMLGSQEEAEDAAQQTFLVAYRDLVRTAEPVALRPWLYGIARHRCLVARRERRRRPIGVVDEPGRSYDLTAEVGMRDDIRAVFADVARLPDEQRAALVLAELGDLSHEEIARVVGCPRGKIKALVFQARASLSAARDARETPCAEIREQLTTLREPALGRATLRRHLNDCPSCRAYRDVVRSRRRRLGTWLPWGPIIGLKRYVIGAVSGSGSGAGCSALTGGRARRGRACRRGTCDGGHPRQRQHRPRHGGSRRRRAGPAGRSRCSDDARCMARRGAGAGGARAKPQTTRRPAHKR